ncbi:MAG: hypothetical protein LBT15_02675 [Synergistaceae bacterium]|nr:hypothetical protein [Synergistaceae bacterium]
MAAAGLTAALFFGVSLSVAFPCGALTVEGLPEWLVPHATRGLSAIWDEIPRSGGSARAETLSLVARRLFTGYRVTIRSSETGDDPRVLFEARDVVPWEVRLVPPDLRAPVSSWFARDVGEMDEEIGRLLEGLPVDALSWVDAALHEQVGEIVDRRLPGWNFSLLVRLEGEKGILQLSFRPGPPFVLAVTPSIYSSTLPVMFQSDLSARLVPGLSPIIGLPVSWIAGHRRDVELLAQEFLEKRNAVSNTRARVEVTFVPDQISRVEGAVNSERLIFQIWISATAGIKGRYPEAGLLLGWNAKRLSGVDLELYSETILDIGELKVTSRLGGRVPLGKNIRAGIEMEWPEQEPWYRVWWSAERIRRPYAWWRWSPGYGHNAALGYRVNEYISVEIHYDDRYGDKLGLRGILLL